MPYIGEIAAITTSIMWAFGSIAFTLAGKEISPIKLNVDRLLLALIFLISTLLLFGLSIEINFKQIILLGLSGLVGLAFGDTFLFSAFREIGPRYSLLIMSSNPAIAAVLSYIFLDEILVEFVIFGMILTSIGIMLVIFSKNKANNFNLNAKGIIYAFIGALGQAGGLILAKLAETNGEEINSIYATTIRIGFTAIIFVPFLISVKRYNFNISKYLNNKKLFMYVLIGTILGPFLGITLSYIAITSTEIAVASTLLSLSPLFIIPLSYFYFKDKTNIKSLIGTLIAIAGVFILFIR